ncbi:hypothetical protein PISMIDRAFT_671997, partial [Pisolithus microcarpus 441]
MESDQPQFARTSDERGSARRAQQNVSIKVILGSDLPYSDGALTTQPCTSRLRERRFTTPTRSSCGRPD